MWGGRRAAGFSMAQREVLALSWVSGSCRQGSGTDAPLADACPEQGHMDLGQGAVHCMRCELCTHGVCSVSRLFMQCRCAVKVCGHAECMGDVGAPSGDVHAFRYRVSGTRPCCMCSVRCGCSSCVRRDVCACLQCDMHAVSCKSVHCSVQGEACTRSARSLWEV